MTTRACLAYQADFTKLNQLWADSRLANRERMRTQPLPVSTSMAKMAWGMAGMLTTHLLTQGRDRRLPKGPAVACACAGALRPG